MKFKNSGLIMSSPNKDLLGYALNTQSQDHEVKTFELLRAMWEICSKPLQTWNHAKPEKDQQEQRERERERDK